MPGSDVGVWMSGVGVWMSGCAQLGARMGRFDCASMWAVTVVVVVVGHHVGGARVDDVPSLPHWMLLKLWI